ncbi:uncharacterized protein LOC128615418 isoform X3 [Ictalurus furcatus]|uniref:uncharacterized protein LOC128615418 isoform X3 n=1 Tax=Ictalurus furcatus TaxID=66913 RepID=UPI002350FE07|nr:uncharacterized protein LOC128615418 isoform X3 [Ictalurus furcatus]
MEQQLKQNRKAQTGVWNTNLRTRTHRNKPLLYWFTFTIKRVALQSCHLSSSKMAERPQKKSKEERVIEYVTKSNFVHNAFILFKKATDIVAECFPFCTLTEEQQILKQILDQDSPVDAEQEISLTSLDMSKQAKIVKDFLQPDLNKVTPGDYVLKIRDVVSIHRQSQIALKKMDGYSFREGTLEDTLYKDKPDMLEEWEQFYLKEEMKMEVIGVLEEFPCDSLNAELVLMVCEDGKVFAYEDEHMHLVAKSLKVLFDHGLQFPGIKRYYCCQAFEHMIDAQWDRVKKSAKMVAPKKQDQDLVDRMEESFLMNLDIIVQRLQAEQPCRVSSNVERHGGNRRRNTPRKSPT